MKYYQKKYKLKKNDYPNAYFYSKHNISLPIYPKIKFKHQKGTPTYFRHRSVKDSKLNINKSIKSQFNLMRINNNKSWPSFFYVNGKKFFLKIYKDKS